MPRRRGTRDWQLGIGVGVVALLGAWFLFVALPAWYGSSPSDTAPESVSEQPGQASADQSSGTTIVATVYYGAEDGRGLVGVERAVAFHAAPVDQARHIVMAQLEPATEPYISVIPEGTVLRALYLTGRGDAFVDLSREVSAAHPGGSLNELFTVYAIVNALTVNLPAVTSVQILVEGREVDTLAGHVDLRHPLQQNIEWVEGVALTQSARSQ